LDCVFISMIKKEKRKKEKIGVAEIIMPWILD
jgi:hypothetical protein